MKKLATLDIETDPFLYGRVPIPFACGFYDGETYMQTWGDDCIADMVTYLQAYPEPLEIFAHNGGKFDWYYFQYALDGPLRMIKNRLVSASLAHHTVRDSYAILPAPLRDFKKDKTNYAHFETQNRERYKVSISKYLKHDCVYLYDVVKAFTDRFGNPLTIASIAWKQARVGHDIRHSTPEFDAEFRPYYFGGRVECFQRGVIRGDLKLYDINSSYPNVMRNYDHAFGTLSYGTKLHDHKIYFAHIIADSDGALPIRDKNGLHFPHCENGEFYACSHEINCALQYGKLRIKKVLECRTFSESINFSEFVDTFIAEKIAAQERGDKTMRTVYKLLLNNAYGKAAQNPENFFDYALYKKDDGYKPCGEFGSDRVLYRKPAEIKGFSYWNVAIGASITSAARAFLFDALQHARDPLYCDTDSILCTHLDARLHDTQLGAWKCEAQADTAFIGGKKMYAIASHGKFVKWASKGVPLEPRDIAQLVKSQKPKIVKLAAPSLHIGKKASFITRTVRNT